MNGVTAAHGSGRHLLHFIGTYVLPVLHVEIVISHKI